MIKLAIVTDAWLPQVNGVVTTLGKTKEYAEKAGHQVHVIHPGPCKTMACPTYPEIRLALNARSYVKREFEEYQPSHVHIATEGPLGFYARRYCLKQQLAFTTSYHTQFPEYIKERFPIPLGISYKFFKSFHSKATRTMVGTPYMKQLLEERGFNNIALWSRGVDHAIFKPGKKDIFSHEYPIWVYVGRVAVEKNIEAFLKLSLPGTKIVIGDGPAKEKLEKIYPDTIFVGYKFGKELAEHIASCDVFVFPSLTDTFGVVMIEAMACGLPVAAFPVTGPRDIVQDGVTGCLHSDLQQAALSALDLNPADCIAQAQEYTWEKATHQFINNLTPAINS